VINSVLPLIELQAQPSHITVYADMSDPLPALLADPVLLEQVLLNLTRNAIEAMQNTAQSQKILRLQISYDETMQRIQILVIDRGHGISQQVAEKLFSPFFSTKNSGMGMGLNICRTAIEFHGGQLTHSANPEGGTIFRLALPVISEDNTAAHG